MKGAVVVGLTIFTGSGFFASFAKGEHVFPSSALVPQPESSRPMSAKESVILGIIRDGTTLKAIEGALVYARRETLEGSRSLVSTGGEVESNSGPDGLYEFDGLTRGLYTIEAVAHGYGWAKIESVRPGTTHDFALFPASSIVGVTTDLRGVPVLDATVCAEHEPGFSEICHRPVRTDSNGHFEIWGAEAGKNRLVVNHEKLAPAIIIDLAVPEQGQINVEVRLHEGAHVVGRLIADDDTPVQGTVVVQELDGEPVPSFLLERMISEAGPNGAFRVERVPPGVHALAISAESYNPKRVEFSVKAKDSLIDLGDVRLESGLTIRGFVQDSSMVLVENAIVTARQVRSIVGIPSFGVVKSRSKTDGSFILAGLQSGQYQVTADASGYGFITLEAVEAGSENIMISLPVQGSVSGVVIDGQKRPLPLYQITARPFRSRAGKYLSETVTDPQGRFDIPVGPGNYLLTVEAPNYVHRTIPNVQVFPGENTDLAHIQLESGVTLRGVVTDEAGYGVYGATVNVLPAGGGEGQYGHALSSDTTAPDGSFEVHGVPEGIISLVAEHPEFAPGGIDSFHVRQSGDTSGIRIVLSRGGTVEGWVRTRDGNGLANTYVQISTASAGTNQFTSPVLVTPMPDGTFRAERIRPGSAKVELLLTYGGSVLTIQEKVVPIQEAETTFVEFVSKQIQVSGYVSRNGAPAPKTRLNLAPERFSMLVFRASNPFLTTPGPQLLTAITDDSGYYELLADAPGNFLATLSTFDQRTTYLTRQVEIPDVDYFTLNLDFAGIQVFGQVVDRYTKEPISSVSVIATPAGEGSGGATIADSSGHFVVELTPGRYRLTVRSADFISDNVDLNLGSSGVDPVIILASRQTNVAGHVLDSAGRGVAALMLSARRVRPEDGTLSLTRTEADGSFRFEGLPAGEYSLFARSSIAGFGFARVTAPAAESLRLNLFPGGMVRVLVRNRDGFPVPGAAIALVSVEGVAVSDLGGEFVSGEQGSVEIWLPARWCTLRVKNADLTAYTDVVAHPNSEAIVEVTLSGRD